MAPDTARGASFAHREARLTGSDERSRSGAPHGQVRRDARFVYAGIVLTALVLAALREIPAQAPSAGAQQAHPSHAPTSADTLRRRAAAVHVGFELLQLPANESIGLFGTAYLVPLGASLSVGPSVYGAVTGSRGGLFTLGAEVSWRRALAGALSLNAGVYAGGGGGGGAPVGGGLMVRPHADLLWEVGAVSVGLSYARVRFVTGLIDGRQFGVVVRTPADFRYVALEQLHAPVAPSARSGLGFERVHATIGAYRPLDGARRASGAPLNATIGLVGVRGEQSLGGGGYWGIEAAGAATGGATGYAEYLATIGARSTLPGDRIGFGARFAVGMGGGGDVDVGGGLLVRAGAEWSIGLSDDIGLVLESGLTAAPEGSFKAQYASLALRWVLDDGVQTASAVSSVRTEWFGGVEQYTAARKDGSTRPLQSVVLRVNRFVAPVVYVTGQARSAAGGGAGGYTVGLFGVGAQGALSGGWTAAAELLLGAAGGGGVDTGSGIVTQPMAYLGYEAPSGIAARFGAGRIRAVSGALSGTVVELSVGFVFGVPARRAH